MNINKPKPLKRAIEAYNSQYSNLEIRVVQSRVLHDRYIIDDNNMFFIGQSFNGIGKKQTFIVNIGIDIRAQTLKSFNILWNSSPRFP